MLSTKKFAITLSLVFLFSIFLSFLPLVGTLGYEYSAFSAVFLSFVAVFLSAEFVNDERVKSFSRSNISDRLASLILLSFVLLLINFLVGLISSLIKDDCSIGDGIKFFVLITVVSVFFSSTLGILTGTVFGKRGFIVGSFILIFTIIYSLSELYNNIHLFLYSPIFAYFPGPLYDKIIPITPTLIVYRFRIVIWGLLFLSLVHLVYGFKKSSFGLSRILSLFVLLILLSLSYYKEQDIGITYSRDYIKKNFLTEIYETEHFSIHYTPGTREARDIGLISQDHEWRYFQLSEFLNVDFDKKINSYIYPDEATRKKLIGAYGTTVANPIHQEIHLVYKYFPHEVLKHELVHVMSSEFGTDWFKISPEWGLVEGLAVAADWNGEGLSRHQWAKTILLRENSINVRDILGFRFLYGSSSVNYTLMGSFCRYLIDQYGIDKFKLFYKTGDTSAYKKSVDELISSWQKFLEKDVELPKDATILSEYKFSDESIFKESCPRKTELLLDLGLKHYKDKNFLKAKNYFKEAYNINQRDPQIMTLLAYSYYYNNDYDELISINDKTTPVVDSNIIKDLQSNVLWEKNGYEYAYNSFRELKESPIPENIRRLVDIKLELRNLNPEIRDMFNEYLRTDDQIKRVAILEELISRYTTFSPGYYLLGKLFILEGDYERALKYLSVANSKGLPTLRVSKDNLKLLGISHYALGNYRDSKKAFEVLKEIDTEGSFATIAGDFIQRSEWALMNDKSNDE